MYIRIILPKRVVGEEYLEVGYLFHDNRLHDRVDVHGTIMKCPIYKRYRKIYPSQFGIVEPEEVPPEQYTINAS